MEGKEALWRTVLWSCGVGRGRLIANHTRLRCNGPSPEVFTRQVCRIPYLAGMVPVELLAPLGPDVRVNAIPSDTAGLRLRYLVFALHLSGWGVTLTVQRLRDAGNHSGWWCSFLFQ